MPSKDYLPKKDQDFPAWAQNFSGIINGTPEAFELSLEAAAEYAAKLVTYQTRLTAAVEPTTRGKRTVFQKNEAKTDLARLSRRIARQIGGLLNVSDTQRLELGLTVPDPTRTRVPVPDFEPHVLITRVNGRSATVELRQAAAQRGKPPKVASATILYHLGTSAPALGTETWRFAANTTRTKVRINFPPSPTGDTAWITAFWSNSRDEAGPSAAPISINLPAGGTLPSEAEAA